MPNVCPPFDVDNMDVQHIWDQSQVTTVWNTGETGDIHFVLANYLKQGDSFKKISKC